MTSRPSHPAPSNGSRVVLFGRMTDGLHVVAVRVTHEGAVIGRVVLRPHTRLVQHRCAVRNRGVEECADSRAVGCLECDMDLAVWFAGGERTQPERGTAPN